MHIHTTQKTSKRLQSIALSLLLGTTLVATEALAWQRQVHRTGPQGQTASRSINTTRSGDGYTRNSTFTGPQGNSATRSAQGSWNASTNSWTRSVNATGNGGQTAGSTVTTTRTETGYNRNATVTGPQGNTVTRSASGHWDPATSTWTKSVTSQGGN